MEDLIKALNIIWPYLEDYNNKWPTSCEHDILYVCGVDMDKIHIEEIHELYKLGFLPGSDEDGAKSVDFKNIGQNDWDKIKGNLTNCFRSYRFGSC